MLSASALSIKISLKLTCGKINIGVTPFPIVLMLHNAVISSPQSAEVTCPTY